MNTKAELDSRMQRVESLVLALEGCPDPQVRDQARELLGTLMEFHSSALGRVVEILEEHRPETGRAIDALAADPLAGGLLLLYGHHPEGVEARVEAALEEVRPALGQHRGDVELVGVEDGTVRLRLKGSCHGCPSSTTTFRNLIEGAIRERAPEIERVEVEGLVSK